MAESKGAISAAIGGNFAILDGLESFPNNNEDGAFEQHVVGSLLVRMASHVLSVRPLNVHNPGTGLLANKAPRQRFSLSCESVLWQDQPDGAMIFFQSSFGALGPPHRVCKASVQNI